MSAPQCALCGSALPPDRRWRIVKALNPRFPRCEPATEACYRGLCSRMGVTPDPQHVARVMRGAR